MFVFFFLGGEAPAFVHTMVAWVPKQAKFR
jgi:hypothetical protein